MSEYHLHHVHIFCTDIDITINWWVKHLKAEIAFDGIMGGSRNVFLRIGEGRLHLYDQSPRNDGKNSLHHIGIRVKDLNTLYKRLIQNGLELRSPIRQFDNWSYIMCEAPDGILLELFQVNEKELERELAGYFGDNSRFDGD